MVANYNHYAIMAKLFRYPSTNFLEDVELCQNFLKQKHPAAAVELELFFAYMKECDLDKRQELYTKTFDVQPICYLDLGYVMFGEDYKRGAFLLSMQHEQKKIDNDCGTELPDNICNVLNLMTISKDREFVADLVWRIVMPCLKMMIAEFNMAKVDLKLKVLRKMHRAIIQEELNHGNVYKHCFTSLLNMLIDEFGERNYDAEQESVLSSAHHQSFFNKQNTLVNNYKLD